MARLFIAKVYSFIDERDSSNRVSKLDVAKHSFREFVLNPLFITDLKSHTLGSTFLYSDNIGDRRERYSQIICDKTVAQIIAYADDSANSLAITLPIYPHANPWGTPFFPLRNTVDTTIGWYNIAYVVRYNPDPQNKVWVIYDKGSFKRVEVLCNLALEDIVDLVRGGSTSTTFSTVDDIPDL